MKKGTNDLSKKKLRLGKKTILQLDQQSMMRLRGGETETCNGCDTLYCDTEYNCKTEMKNCKTLTASCKVDACV